MDTSQTLIAKEVTDRLKNVLQEDVAVTMTFLSNGMWNSLSVGLIGLSLEINQLSVRSDISKRANKIRIDLPVGLSIQTEHGTLVFESVVTSVETSGSSCKILIRVPDKIEKMQRRAYIRVAVPNSMKVNVIFWHRGYDDDTEISPPVEKCWQGELVNISAGGLQILVSKEMSTCFKDCQLIGVQFTPYSYQKPIIAEAVIKHLSRLDGSEYISIGAEFIGLESSRTGRQNIKRIIKTVNYYGKRNPLSDKEILPLG